MAGNSLFNQKKMVLEKEILPFTKGNTGALKRKNMFLCIKSAKFSSTKKKSERRAPYWAQTLDFGGQGSQSP